MQTILAQHALRERIVRDYTWERAAQLTLEAYQHVLDGA